MKLNTPRLSIKKYLMTIIVFILVNTLFIVSLNLITFPVKGLSNITNLLFSNNLVFEFAYILMDGIINTLFLSGLYLFRIDSRPLLYRKYCILECLMYCVTTFIISTIIDSLPYEIKYSISNITLTNGEIISSNSIIVQKWFSGEFKLLYTYIILAIGYVGNFLRIKMLIDK
jgi:hypothetical protein